MRYRHGRTLLAATDIELSFNFLHLAEEQVVYLSSSFLVNVLLDRGTFGQLLEVLKHFNGIRDRLDMLESQLDNSGVEDLDVFYVILIGLAEIVVPVGLFDIKNVVV